MSDIPRINHTDLLGIIQSDFPVNERPFHVISEHLKLPEQKVIDTVQSLIDSKIIRTLGPVFDPRKLGYTTTLIAAEVERERIRDLKDSMLSVREITHSYLRDHTLNLWFTITALSKEREIDISTWVENFPGVKRIVNLPAVTVYKINAVFGVDNKGRFHSGSYTNYHCQLNESEQNIVRALQHEFPLVEKPFRIIADTAGISETELIRIINRWLRDGTIRRFGARINHRRAGYIVNILAVWSGKPIDEWGRKFAERAEVTHCYRRKSYPGWPYELYTMVHARTEEEMTGILQGMKIIAHGSEIVLLKTTDQLKKTSMKYFLEDEKWHFPSHE